MNWFSFISGGITVIVANALFTCGQEEEVGVEINETETIGDVGAYDFSGRFVILSCQTCRKLKKHREVKTNLFQCIKCKRHVDLR